MTWPRPVGGGPVRPVKLVWKPAPSASSARPRERAAGAAVPAEQAPPARTEAICCGGHAGHGGRRPRCEAGIGLLPLPGPTGALRRRVLHDHVDSARSLANSESRLWVSVSVKMNVPATNAIPNTIANSGQQQPARWARRPASAIRSTSAPPASSAGRAHSAALGSSSVAGDPAVGEEHHPVGVRGGDRVVGDHHDGLAELAHASRRNVEHLGPDRESRLPVGSSAKITSGRLTSARAHGDPLLLAAGQLGGPVREPVGQARPCRPRSPATPGRACGRRGRSGSRMFSLRGQRRQQVERLEDEADPVPAQPGELPVGQTRSAPRRRSSTWPAVGRVEPGQAVHQGGLARAGRAHDRGERAGRESRC